MPPAGYFTDDSMLRRVQREYVVALAGPRALLMQAAHPEAFEQFIKRTGSLDDPYGRLHRTAAVLDAIGFGTRQDADRATRPVRNIHRHYGADQPHLLLWVLGTLIDSNLLVYQRYVKPLTLEQRQSYYDDFKVVGELFDLHEMPETIEDFEAYMRAMLRSGDLHVSQEAKDLAVDIVMRPPLPPVMLPVRELVNQVTVGLLPREVRRLYGFRWDPARAAALRGQQEYIRRLLLPALPRRVRTVPSAT
jgi:uncharacterized protein (DUF2236 family)